MYRSLLSTGPYLPCHTVIRLPVPILLYKQFIYINTNCYRPFYNGGLTTITNTYTYKYIFKYEYKINKYIELYRITPILCRFTTTASLLAPNTGLNTY